MVDLLVANKLARHPQTASTLRALDRALFLPTSDPREYKEPYANKPQSLGFQCTMSSPSHHARVLDELLAQERQPLRAGSRVLDVGMGSGYMTAAFAINACRDNAGCVVGVERVPALLSMAERCLGACPATAALSTTSLRTCAAYGTSSSSSSSSWDVATWGNAFDVIHLGFSLVRARLAPARVVPRPPPNARNKGQLERRQLGHSNHL